MKTNKRKLITSALPYVNNSPHLGNIVGSVLSADVYTRFCKKNGENAIYICGTDDYGTATELKAKTDGISCKQVVEKHRNIMIKVFDWFSIKFDKFGQTSNPDHTKIVQAIFEHIKKQRIVKDKMEQFYCNTCGMFLSDRYLTGTCYKCKSYGVQGDQCDSCGMLLKNHDIIDPECYLCRNTPLLKETEHFFLKLDQKSEFLKELYLQKSDNWSKNASEITLQWLNKDLHKRCITRDLKWGIPVPNIDKVFYVWFDAVIGYISFTKEYLEEQENISFSDYESIRKKFESFELIQFMGKDNVPFHTIIFPAISDFVADKLSVTEYLMFENKKFSKSKKIGIFGIDLINDQFGPSDLWRYYLIKIRPETKDSNFSVSDFILSITELQNNFGNLCNRVLKYIHKNMQRKVYFKKSSDSEFYQKFIHNINELVHKYHKEMNKISLRAALITLLEICQKSNNFLQQVFSFSQSKLEKNNSFSLVFSVVVLLSDLFDPFIPNICKKLRIMCDSKEKNISELIIINEHIINEKIDVLIKPLSDEILVQLKNMKK